METGTSKLMALRHGSDERALARARSRANKNGGEVFFFDGDHWSGPKGAKVELEKDPFYIGKRVKALGNEILRLTKEFNAEAAKYRAAMVGRKYENVTAADAREISREIQSEAIGLGAGVHQVADGPDGLARYTVTVTDVSGI